MKAVPLLPLLSALLLSSTPAQQAHWPGTQWPEVRPSVAGLDEAKLQDARAYSDSAGGSGLIIYQGTAVFHWGDQKKLYDIKSATKSFGATALGLAIKDGKMQLEDLARKHHPSLGVPPESNRDTGWLDQITLLHLATHTAGFEKPGGYEKLIFEPGTKWLYSDGGPNWLAECITLVYRRDLEDLLFERLFTPIGITRSDLRWRPNQYRPHEIEGIPRREFGAGVHANVNALARLGYLYLRKGAWNGQRILSEEFVETATRPIPSITGLPVVGDDHRGASDHYGLLWWNNADGSLRKVPRDAYWAWGLYDSLIVVIPSLDLVIARGGERGKSWPRDKDWDHYRVLEPFLAPIAASVPKDERAEAPYPPSEVIAGIEWAPTDEIIRQASGSDNWPVTWADDDALYTAYGDGWGFEPRVEKKLSLGLAKVVGAPTHFHGINIRSPIEQLGDGAHGPKASGMLMVDGILYMLVRNATNSQLAWSNDHGQNWTWADWKFTTSFGCPTFLNFGRNYSGARDEFVYIYSLDGNSAYEPADGMVLARVPKDQITRRPAYEFFSGFDSDNHPRWNKDIHSRKHVFRFPANCYRSGITYHPALKRYLWVQILPQSTDQRGPRFQGGLGIYDAPEPWGPWTTAFFTRDWDTGPGETASFPVKWMNDDGRQLHLLFSGNDHFSVRPAELILK